MLLFSLVTSCSNSTAFLSVVSMQFRKVLHLFLLWDLRSAEDWIKKMEFGKKRWQQLGRYLIFLNIIWVPSFATADVSFTQTFLVYRRNKSVRYLFSKYTSHLIKLCNRRQSVLSNAQILMNVFNCPTHWNLVCYFHLLHSYLFCPYCIVYYSWFCLHKCMLHLNFPILK